MTRRLIQFFIIWTVGSLLKAAPVGIHLPQGTVEGVMENGLHYIILPHSNPVHKVELRLVMRLGSVQETEEQKGAAHFLEHMAFAGTRHFPNRTMVAYLESLGMKYGRDINAVTGYDRTVFMLSVPMGPEDTCVLDSTLLILRDWLDGIDFEAKRTKQERGVILEELRGYDIGDDFYSLKIGNNIYSRRLPLGTAEDIRAIDRKTLKAFYQKWYTPQLATVIVVGQVDPQKTENLIRERFGDVAKKNVQEDMTCPLTYEAGIQIQEHVDTLQRNCTLELMLPHQTVVTRTLDDMLRKEQGRLLVRLLGSRFQARKYSCQVSDSWYLSDKNHFVLSVDGANREKVRSVMSRCLAEIDLILREGFPEEELEASRVDLLQSLQLPDAERTSYDRCDDLTDYVLSGDRYVCRTEDLVALKQKLAQTKSQDLQMLLASWMAAKDTTQLIAMRDNQIGLPQITPKWVEQIWSAKDTVRLSSYIYTSSKTNVKRVPTPPCLSRTYKYRPSDVKLEKKYPDLGVTEVRLVNGLCLILRPTPDRTGRVLVNLFGRGGLSDIPKRDYYLYEGAAGYIEMGGIAKVPYDTLSEYMLQRDLSMNVAINNGWHDILAAAPWKETQALLNLINEKMHDPELCYSDFEEIRQDELETFREETILDKMMKLDSERRLTNQLNRLVGNVPEAALRPRSKKDIENLSLDSIADYFKRLYVNPDGMTLVVTGDFPMDEMKKLLVSSFSSMTPFSNALNYPKFVRPELTCEYLQGFPNERESQTILEYVYPHYYEPSLRNGLVLKIMRDLLQNRLLDILREREHIVYSPYASLYYNGCPEQTFYLNLSLSVDSANVWRTDSLVRLIVRDLQTKPVSVTELEHIKRSFRVTRKQVLTPSASVEWRKTLVNLLKNGEDLKDFEQYDACLQQITADEIREAFCRYMDPDHFVLLYIGTRPNDISGNK